ncbi:MAG: hypothetical protein KatS3mg030_552 [Saprospiraceae bacterium]|nr:MAG: hypothetical protein KatS3mg030_552 [Saprospiraceae bacterium]
MDQNIFIVRKYLFENAFASRELNWDYCWEVVFNNGLSGGGIFSGNGVASPGSGNSSGSQYSVSAYCVHCTCNPHHDCSEINQCHCSNPPYWVIVIRTNFSDGNGGGDSRANEYEDCLDIITNGVPVMPPPFEDAGQVSPPNDPFLECQENALDFSSDHCGVRTRSKANGVDLSSFCMDGGGYDAQAALMAVMGLTTEQQTWLASNPTLFNDVVAFLDDKCWDEGAVEFTNSAFNLMMYDSDVKWVRLTELFDILQQDPNALWCDQSGGELNLNDYQELLNFEPPQECQDRLQYLQNFQLIDDGNTALTNVDYFSIEIIQEPDFDGDGVPDTADKIFVVLRNNFTSLSLGENKFLTSICKPNIPFYASWEFLFFENQDETLWESNNPLTTIFTIEAEANAVIPGSGVEPLLNAIEDDGAVMCTQYTEDCCWIFTALKNIALNGTQPFSGNRQFGITLNSNGNYEFYTKAIDRAKTATMLSVATIWSDPDCDARDYYQLASVTWNNLMEKIVSFISAYGGNAAINNTLQEFVDYEDVLSKLKSNSPINIVPCN